MKIVKRYISYRSAPRIYSMGHVRKCFPELANPVVQDWIKRGYLSCGKEEQGASRSVFTFNWAEILLVGLIGHFSLYGVLKGQVQVNATFDTREGGQNFGEMRLTTPGKILDYCEMNGYDVVVTIMPVLQSSPFRRFSRNPRGKNAVWQFEILFHQEENFQSFYRNWSNIAGKNFMNFPSFAFITLSQIRKHVITALGITDQV